MSEMIAECVCDLVDMVICQRQPECLADIVGRLRLAPVKRKDIEALRQQIRQGLDPLLVVVQR